jgi:RNA polymerase sigma-70 factor (ECF subfamily)
VVEYSGDIKSKSDHELVTEFKATGNSIVVGELFRRYKHLVLGVCRKYLKDDDESQDVQMQIFEKLLTDLNKHEIDQFKAWLYMVTRNTCLMYLRSLKSKKAGQAEMQKVLEQDMEIESSLHLSDEGSNNRMLDLMEQMLEQLQETQKICVDMFYLKKKT